MYLTFYHLKEEPFRLTPDPKFLQMAEPHRQALLSLAHGIASRKGLLVLSGPIGTGKTTVLNSLLGVLARQYPQNTLPTALIVNPRMSRDELLETLLFEFEVPGVFGSRPCRLAALQGLMFAACRAGGTCLLIVDEAHLLSIDVLEEIRLLMNADGHREKPLQVILCGQPEVTVLLRDPALKAVQQRIAGRAVLRELSRSETKMYITERLRIAGLEEAVPFSISSCDRIYEYTGGVPRLINIVCDTCLAIGCETGRAQIGEDIVEEAAIRHELEPGSPLPGGSDSPILPTLSDSFQSTKPAGRSEL
jgi:general secretion pathway protein A